eukprot:7717648-Karenia_brevis.AAC.1
MVANIYKGRVIFDPADDARLVGEKTSTVHDKFLDMRISLSFTSIKVDMWHTNIESIKNADLGKVKKSRFPPS